MKRSAGFFVAFVCSVALLAPAQAKEALIIKDSSKQTRPMNLDFSANVNWYWVGGTVFFSYPVAPNGFLKKLNDSFDIYAAVYTGFWWWGNNAWVIGPELGARWKFHLTQSWTVFAQLGAGPRFTVGDIVAHSVWFDINGGVGAYWNIKKRFCMRFDLGSHGLGVGIGIPLGG